MSLSRPDGYRLGAGKERVSLDVFSNFFVEEFGLTPESIEGYQDNFLYGDFRLDSSTTIEVKSQPIDPVRYKENFVEVFEVTENPLHVDGFTKVADYLQISQKVLSCIPVRDMRTGSRAPLGTQPFVSVSITSMTYARWIAYVNSAGGGKHIYLYDQTELLSHLRRTVRRGFVRGAGNSNEDTFGLFVPLPKHRWERGSDGWVYAGSDKSPQMT